MNSFKQKIVSSAVFISIVGFLFLSPLTVKKADAIFGVVDSSITAVMADIPATLYNIGKQIAGVFFRQLRNRMVKQLQNDMVNWVQGGGKPRFITDPGKWLTDNANAAAVTVLDEYFGPKGVDVCSPFRANLRLLVARPLIMPEKQARCTLGDIKDNLEKFKDNFSKGGGWRTWIRLHEVNNTLPGSYLAATQLIGGKISQEGNTAQAQLTAGKGFLDQTECNKISAQKYRSIATGQIPTADDYIKFMSELGSNGQMINTTGYSIGFGEAGSVRFLDVFEPIGTERVEVSFQQPVPIGKVNNNPILGVQCTDKKTTTPGSIVGDQISGVLKSTGIDKLINAQEIGQILDAVIDAAVNKVAREGLAHMQSGKGSYTSPQPGNRSSGSKKTQRDAQGLEGITAADTLNKLLGLKTNIDRLKRTFNARTTGTAVDNFTNAILLIPSLADDRECGSAAAGTQQKIQACLFNFSKQVRTVEDGVTTYYGDDFDLRKEENNPSPYVANQILHQKIAELWSWIDAKAASFESGIESQSCYALSIDTDPGETRLPIYYAGDEERDEEYFDWTGSNHTYNRYIKVKDSDPIPRLTGNDNIAMINAIKNTASVQIAANNTAADNYNQIITNLRTTQDSLQSDYDFVDAASPGLILYTNLLMGYDKAGRNLTIDEEQTSLSALATKYSEALEGRDEAAIITARSNFVRGKMGAERVWEETETTNEATARTDALAEAQANGFSSYIDYFFHLADTNSSAAQDYAIRIGQSSKKTALVRRARVLINESRIEIPRIVTAINSEGVTMRIPVEDVITGQIVIIGPSETIPFNGFVERGASRVNKTKVTERRNDNADVRPGTTVTAGYVNFSEANGGREIQIQVTGYADEFMDTGMSPSEALSKAMSENNPLTNDPTTNKPYLPFGIEQLTNELELRESKISKMQNDTANKTGAFVTDYAEMARLGVDGGESEWDKYYYNRSQYAYAAIIKNWLTNHTLCR